MSAYPERRKGKLTGKWIGEVVMQGDKRRKRFDTKKDAEKWADFVKLTGAPPPEEPQADAGPTFGAVMLEAKEAKPEWRRGRDKTGLQRAEYVTEFVGRDTPLADVTTSVLDRLVASLRKRPGRAGKIAPGTINRYLSAASAVLTFAKERGYLSAAPVIPWQREGGKRLHWLTEEAEAAVCADMIQRGQHAAALICRVLTATGMRWGEFESLEPDQIDVRERDAWVRLWETKTDDPRSVPIDRDLARSLRALLVRNGAPNYYTFRKELKKALKSAGQSASVCVHSLRHTTATRLMQRGVSIAIIQKFLGHRAIQTTMRYVKVADDDLTQAAKKLSPHAGQSASEVVEKLEEVPA